MTEHGYAVRPRSTAHIALAAEAFLARCEPTHLTSGNALNLAELVDRSLQRERILVYPASEKELPDAEAETRAGDGEWLLILMREEFYAALFDRSSNTVRARSTLGHELGHAVLHAAEVRAGRLRPHSFALRRAPRHQLKPFRDSEWQAHSFAGALLLPRPALARCGITDERALAELFDVSEAFVRSHLKRISKIPS